MGLKPRAALRRPGGVAYYVWHTAYKDGVCVLNPPGVSKGWQLRRGLSRREGWPSSVVCDMDKSFRRDQGFADSLHGAALLVISTRLKEFLEGRTGGDVEFLPLQIKNHSGSIASKDYWVMNPLGTLDCIDIDASGATWNDIAPDQIAFCERIVIDPQRVPNRSRLFRLQHMPTRIIIRADLTKELVNAGFEGLYFVPAEGHSGICATPGTSGTIFT